MGFSQEPPRRGYPLTPNRLGSGLLQRDISLRSVRRSTSYEEEQEQAQAQSFGSFSDDEKFKSTRASATASGDVADNLQEASDVHWLNSLDGEACLLVDSYRDLGDGIAVAEAVSLIQSGTARGGANSSFPASRVGMNPVTRVRCTLEALETWIGQASMPPRLLQAEFPQLICAGLPTACRDLIALLKNLHNKRRNLRGGDVSLARVANVDSAPRGALLFPTRPLTQVPTRQYPNESRLQASSESTLAVTRGMRSTDLPTNRTFRDLSGGPASARQRSLQDDDSVGRSRKAMHEVGAVEPRTSPSQSSRSLKREEVTSRSRQPRGMDGQKQPPTREKRSSSCSEENGVSRGRKSGATTAVRRAGRRRTPSPQSFVQKGGVIAGRKAAIAGETGARRPDRRDVLRWMDRFGVHVDWSLLTPEESPCHERLSNGELLCELAAAVDYAASGGRGLPLVELPLYPRRFVLKGTCGSSPPNAARSRHNVRTALRAFRTLGSVGGLWLHSEEAILAGDHTAIWGLLQDIHANYSRLHPHSRQPAARHVPNRCVSNNEDAKGSGLRKMSFEHNGDSHDSCRCEPELKKFSPPLPMPTPPGPPSHYQRNPAGARRKESGSGDNAAPEITERGRLLLSNPSATVVPSDVSDAANALALDGIIRRNRTKAVDSDELGCVAPAQPLDQPTPPAPTNQTSAKAWTQMFCSAVKKRGPRLAKTLPKSRMATPVYRGNHAEEKGEEEGENITGGNGKQSSIFRPQPQPRSSPSASPPPPPNLPPPISTNNNQNSTRTPSQNCASSTLVQTSRQGAISRVSPRSEYQGDPAPNQQSSPHTPDVSTVPIPSSVPVHRSRAADNLSLSTIFGTPLAVMREKGDPLETRIPSKRHNANYGISLPLISEGHETVVSSALVTTSAFSPELQCTTAQRSGTTTVHESTARVGDRPPEHDPTKYLETMLSSDGKAAAKDTASWLGWDPLGENGGRDLAWGMTTVGFGGGRGDSCERHVHDVWQQQSRLQTPTSAVVDAQTPACSLPQSQQPVSSMLSGVALVDVTGVPCSGPPISGATINNSQQLLPVRKGQNNTWAGTGNVAYVSHGVPIGGLPLGLAEHQVPIDPFRRPPGSDLLPMCIV